MTRSSQRRGRIAEDHVAARLRADGWEVLERNARPQGTRGEIDLIAREGADLVFVEVKARTIGGRLGPTTPVEAVGPQKQRRLRALAAAWLRELSPGSARFARVRFDVAGVWIAADGRIVRCEHLRAAF